MFLNFFDDSPADKSNGLAESADRLTAELSRIAAVDDEGGFDWEYWTSTEEVGKKDDRCLWMIVESAEPTSMIGSSLGVEGFS